MKTSAPYEAVEQQDLTPSRAGRIDFWTSTEYSGFMAGLIRELKGHGFEARQRYHISEASYRAAKSPGARLFLRFRQYVGYPLQLMAALGGGRLRGHSGARGDVCVIATNTFYAPLLATLFHQRVVHLVYDLFPEAMIHSGKWKEGTVKVRLVRWITKQTLKRAELNVFLGERLKGYVESIHGDCGPSAVIAVGADQSLFSASPNQRLERRTLNAEPRLGGTRKHRTPLGRDSEASNDSEPVAEAESTPSILYCGNFGNMHDSATLFGYWRSLGSPDPTKIPRFEFFCSGPKRAALEAELQSLPDSLREQIRLGGGLDPKAWIETMERADVALVTMAAGAETVVMPSKTYSAMMAGQAILAIAPEDSDLVDLIKAADCGWWLEPGDVEGLFRTIEVLCRDRELLMEKRENAFRYAHAHLGQNALAKQWVEALGEL